MSVPYKDAQEQKAAQRRSYLRNKVAHNAAVIERRQRLRKRVQAYKLNRGCARCGYKRSAKALDVHHPNGKKSQSESIANLVRRGFAWNNILLHLAVCEIICSNCHREHHDVDWVENI